MALLLCTFDQLELYIEWAFAQRGEATPSPSVQAYPGVFVGDLSQLNRFKRNAFSAVVGTLFVLAFSGNLGTLYVNTRRKLRPFFRACLISLACSDLVSSVFCTVSYMAQFQAEYLQLWTIGGFMCKFVPFITTTSVLSGSLTLVAIALDRYLAVMRPVLGFWSPDKRFSTLCMLLIWACSIGSSGPLLGIYDYRQIFLLEVEDSGEESGGKEVVATAVPEELMVTELEMVHMCLAGDHDVGLYYVILFTLIFLPCIVSFLWLNAVIARQLWLRRHYHQEQQVQQQEPKEGQFKTMANGGDLLMPSTLVSAMGVAVPFALDSTPLPPKSPVKDPVKKITVAALAREARHRRMVVVVLLMMAVFICLRLPAWVFLIMRLYGSYSEPIDWLLYFSFGILNLFSCALNPIFYTFLTQTIRTVSLVKQKLLGFLGCPPGKVHDGMPTEQMDKSRCCCGLRPPTFTWRCYPSRDRAATTVVRDGNQPDPPSDQAQPDPSSLRRFLSYKHEVFSIYKPCGDSSSASIESSA